MDNVGLTIYQNASENGGLCQVTIVRAQISGPVNNKQDCKIDRVSVNYTDLYFHYYLSFRM